LIGLLSNMSRIHGLKSGKTLKIFRGHTSFVNDCTFNLDGTRIISASSDGTFKVWDTKTTDCISTFSPMLAGGQPVQTAIHNILNNPKNAEELILCNKSPKLFIVNMKGQVHTLHSFSHSSSILTLFLYSYTHSFIHSTIPSSHVSFD
jgi:WD40 repeat protein